jgi:hypothetical protein
MDCKGGATLRLASTGEGKAKTRVALFRDAKVRQRSVRPRCAKHCKCKGNRHYFYPLYAGKGEEDGEINRLRFTDLGLLSELWRPDGRGGDFR